MIEGRPLTASSGPFTGTGTKRGPSAAPTGYSPPEFTTERTRQQEDDSQPLLIAFIMGRWRLLLTTLTSKLEVRAPLLRWKVTVVSTGPSTWTCAAPADLGMLAPL